MDVLGTLAICALVCFSSGQETAGFPGADAWREAWRDLDALARSAPGSVEHRRIASDLAGFQARHERGARKRHDRSEAFRSRLLGAHLSRLSGAPFQPVAEPGVPVIWLPGEAWIAAQVCGPGPTRVAALEAALVEVSAGELRACVELGFRLAQSDAMDLRLDWALREARALDTRVRAAAPNDLPVEYRSGTRIAGLHSLISRMRGEHAQAIAVLEAQLESTPDLRGRSELYAELGRARLAAGETGLALENLGAALALGSTETACLLGRLALSDSVVPRARSLFRSLLERDSRPSPALRGHGLALLADARSGSTASGNLPDIPR